MHRFRYRTRYFTDSDIFGSKEFVSTNHRRFKNLFKSKHEKKLKLIKGQEKDICALIREVKRNAEAADAVRKAIPHSKVYGRP